jgi:protein arginine kinase
VKSVSPDILDYERRARKALSRGERQRLHDQVSRAFGILSNAWQISSEETMQHLSSVRMGINLELVNDVEIPTVNELFVQTQPAHLQKIHGRAMEKSERNEVRAAFLRQRLGRRAPPQN